MFNDQIAPKMKGEVSIFRMDEPDQLLFHRKNVIVNGTSFLFGSLLSVSGGPAGSLVPPVAGIWGLSVGAGGTSAQGFSADQEPDPTALQFAMVSEITRVQLSTVNFLDANLNPTTTQTTTLGLLTVLNSEQNEINVAIREMGLFGGGTTSVAQGGPTDMLTAPMLNPASPVPNSTILVNYITLSSFLLPQGEDIGVLWRLSL
jgi:hypothetical protein